MTRAPKGRAKRVPSELAFAIQGELHVPLPGAADGALAIVTERFKARVGG